MGKMNWALTAELAEPIASSVAQKENQDKSAEPSSFKRGGIVRRTGKATVHKGERVLTKAQGKKYNSRKAIS